jgi:hypothetical protein
MNKPLKALLVKKHGDTLKVEGPVEASEIRGRDIDLVIVFCTHKELHSPERSQEYKIFDECTFSSKLSQEVGRPIKQVRPLSYMISSLLLEDVKNFKFNNLIYNE